VEELQGMEGKFQGLEMEVYDNNYAGEINVVVRKMIAGTTVFERCKIKNCVAKRTL